jgi:hypothetical protein
MNAEIEDPLKALSEIYKPDVRQANLVGDLSDIHSVLTEIVLHDGVPSNVRELFETAKNVSLYSWFVYRFHQVAEMVAFSALEMALRERAGHAEFGPQGAAKIPGLSQLLTRAMAEKWMRTENYPSLRVMAVKRARDAQFARFLQRQGMTPAEIVPMPDPTEEEIAAAMCEIDVPQILIDTAPQLRNSLAHGSSRVSPTSIWTLRLTSEAINQIFESKQSTPDGT